MPRENFPMHPNFPPHPPAADRRSRVARPRRREPLAHAVHPSGIAPIAMAPHRRTSTGALPTAVLLIALAASTTEAQVTPRLMIRGREQVLHVYGPRTGAPVIVSSGDGGWIH